MGRLEEFVSALAVDPYFLTGLGPDREPDCYAGAIKGYTHRQDGDMLVQEWVCPPNSVIPEHSHPDVDGYAIRVRGEIRFTVDGKTARPKVIEFAGRRQPIVSVPAGAPHSAIIGSSGASFLSVTHWRSGTIPSSVHLNWDGPPFDLRHETELKDI